MLCYVAGITVVKQRGNLLPQTDQKEPKCLSLCMELALEAICAGHSCYQHRKIALETS